MQHPGQTRLKEELHAHAAMNWKGMRCTIRPHVKNCCTCQVNKQYKHKYKLLPAKLVITNPCEALGVVLIGPYTLKGNDGTEIDFCVKISWFEVAELPVTTDAVIPMDTKGQKVIKQNNTKSPYFDKSSAMISNSE